MSQLRTERNSLIEASAESTDIGFGGAANFTLTLRVADMLSRSALVPTSYQGEKGLPNCVIALEIANRLNISWLAVMQNLYVVHGRPAWMATFVIAAVNGCGRYNSLRYELSGNGESRQCIAWTTEKHCPIPANVRTLEDARKVNLPILESTPITWNMVKAEGWASKAGSKWLTMADQMFRYRAAAFWGRTYAPELLMGIVTKEEAEDWEVAKKVKVIGDIETKLNDIPAREPQAEPTQEPVVKPDGEIVDVPSEPVKEPEKTAKPEPKKKQPAYHSATPEQLDAIESTIKESGLTMREALDGHNGSAGGQIMSVVQLSKEQASVVLAKIAAAIEAQKAKDEREGE